ncbi:MAG: LLM class flavin-dependent oxidoreductase [Deltaproteobacteria bacterium]|nr:LLM class flavin-dependent oxidoreductase [Deltaproteobacteria bacterium]
MQRKNLQFGTLHLFDNPVHKAEHQIVKKQLEFMQAAADLGFDSIWSAEHHVSEYGYRASDRVDACAEGGSAIAA